MRHYSWYYDSVGVYPQGGSKDGEGLTAGLHFCSYGEKG